MIIKINALKQMLRGVKGAQRASYQNRSANIEKDGLFELGRDGQVLAGARSSGQPKKQGRQDTADVCRR